MQPYNYTINTGNVGDSFDKGFNRTVSMGITAAEFQKAQKLADAQQIANEQAMQKRADFQSAAENPTYDSVRKLMIKYPELSEQFKRSLDTMGEQRKQGVLSGAFSVAQALEKGNTEAALKLVDTAIEAAKNSNDTENEFQFKTTRDMILANPNAALLSLHGTLYAGLGGDKYAAARKNLGDDARAAELQPGLVAKGQAAADKEGVEAKYADEKARTDIGNTRSQIEDRKFDQRIKAMESALKREDNALKREELQIKLDEARMKRDESQRGKVADYETARASVDNFLDTSARLKKNPMLSRVLGPIEGKFNTAPLSNEAADAVALIDTLKSQAFLSQVSSMKGTGALSEKEGAKLESALTSLSRVQSEKQFLENLAVAEDILSKVKENAANRSGVQPKQDEQKSAPVANDALARLKQKYGVK
jgi:hypothetical protein